MPLACHRDTRLPSPTMDLVDPDDAVLAAAVPALGEPLAIEFANTYFAVRGAPRDGVATGPLLGAWLARHRDERDLALIPHAPLDVGSGVALDVAAFRGLRDAIRVLAAAAS